MLEPRYNAQNYQAGGVCERVELLEQLGRIKSSSGHPADSTFINDLVTLYKGTSGMEQFIQMENGQGQKLSLGPTSLRVAASYSNEQRNDRTLAVPLVYSGIAVPLTDGFPTLPLETIFVEAGDYAGKQETIDAINTLFNLNIDPNKPRTRIEPIAPNDMLRALNTQGITTIAADTVVQRCDAYVPVRQGLTTELEVQLATSANASADSSVYMINTYQDQLHVTNAQLEGPNRTRKISSLTQEGQREPIMVSAAREGQTDEFVILVESHTTKPSEDPDGDFDRYSELASMMRITVHYVGAEFLDAVDESKLEKPQ